MDCLHLQARIDPGAIEHNCRVLKSFAPRSRFCVAIKANAYGHGVALALPAVRRAGVDMLAVACVEEAGELRALGWDGPILLFGSELSLHVGPPQHRIAEYVVEQGIRVTLTRPQDADCLIRAARAIGKPAPVHLALDTGMCRMGLGPEDLNTLIEDLRTHPEIQIEGLYTHFATADWADKTFAREQLGRFTDFLREIRGAGISIPIVHAANSGATVDLPETHFDMIRPGISVYGYHASGEIQNRADLRPALQLVGGLILVKRVPAGSVIGYGCTFEAKRPTTLGLVPIGYADGYFRELSNRGTMLVKGQPAPVIGRVSMDQTIVDLSDLAEHGLDPRAGDEVIIYDNRRESPNGVEKVADLLGTIPHVVTTTLGRRVKRVAADSAAPAAKDSAGHE